MVQESLSLGISSEYDYFTVNMVIYFYLTRTSLECKEGIVKDIN